MKPNSFIVVVNGKLDSLNEYLIFQDTKLSVYLNTRNHNHVRQETENNNITIHIGERFNVLSGENSDRFAGTKICYDHASNNLEVKSDTLGTAPIFYKIESDVCVFSNRLENIALSEEVINWNAIQQYLNSGYTIDSSTYYRKIEQTLPNETISISIVDHPIALQKKPTNAACQRREAANSSDISDELRMALEAREKSVLMASAGWDSRTLLACGSQRYFAAFTHGDLQSREIKIAERILVDQKTNHTLIALEDYDLQSAVIEEMIDELGYCIFPIWYLAAKSISKGHAAPMSSGVLGEQLGGHYGLASTGSRSDKFKSLLTSLYISKVNASQIENLRNKLTKPYDSHWFLSDHGNDFFKSLAKETQAIAIASLDDDFNVYKDWQVAFERYNMRHRARQYILKQCQASTPFDGYIIPLGDPKLAELIYTMPFQDRVHNKLNKAILGNLNKSLLGYPMAATLVNASYPVGLQEASRVIRIIMEKVLLRFNNSKPRLGWFNYNFLENSNLLHEIVDNLSHSIWDKRKMHSSIKRQKELGIDPGHTLDMICKIRTVDHYIYPKQL